ncbi:hypothetical protein PIB30_057979 [Stylosanthes scabra]|uniref:Uncharacterized protein n=1 Tax=Stylosanthes scabra TaxID=79078 RepID=A0ABU6TJM1_9FABA|nr:hypothetical protein [Stylosanthes scabra]
MEGRGVRQCVIAWEMTKLHEEFWRGTVREANEVFFMRKPKGEPTILIEGQTSYKAESPSDSEPEDELRELIASGESLSTAVKLVAGRTSTSKKTIYSLASSRRRFKLMPTSHVFQTQVADLRKNLNVVNALPQIRSSVKFKRVMQTIFSLGNALKQGIPRVDSLGSHIFSKRWWWCCCCCSCSRES